MKQIKENAKTKMEKSINVMLSDFAGIRAGRANPSVLNAGVNTFFYALAE